MDQLRATVKQRDLTRYLKAWANAGFREPRAEIKQDGTVILFPVDDKTGETKNDWD